MKTDSVKSSWVALGLFYLVLVLIISVLDFVYKVLALPYWGVQVGLVTAGVGLFALIGIFLPKVSAGQGIWLAFVIGIFTIIPAVLMGLGRIPDLWPQYFYIAFGMAAGSFLTVAFIKFSHKMLVKEEQPELERD